MNPSKEMEIEEQYYDDDVCHANELDSQMDMSSVRETGLPAHNDQNACL